MCIGGPSALKIGTVLTSSSEECCHYVLGTSGVSHLHINVLNLKITYRSVHINKFTSITSRPWLVQPYICDISGHSIYG